MRLRSVARVIPSSLAAWLVALANGSVAHEAVFADHGHGALCLDDRPVPLSTLAVTGPRRAMARATRLIYEVSRKFALEFDAHPPIGIL